MSKCFDCDSGDTKRYYVRIVPCAGPGCEVGYPRTLCVNHRQELAAKLAKDTTCTFSIVGIEEYQQECEAEKLFNEVLREYEREARERGERALLQMLDP